MTLEIDTPSTIEQPLYEDQLEIAENEERVRSSPIRQQLLNMAPVVTLGQPQCWNLADLTSRKGGSLPAEIDLSLREADFYLLQLTYSLLPQRDAHVTWSRFDVYLEPLSGLNVPLAFDLYPREIYDEIKGDWKVVIEPSLSFAAFEGAKVEGKLGQVLTTINYRKLEPVVVAYGLLQPHCGWDYQRSHQNPLLGIQVGYIIVKKPHEAGSVRVIMDVRSEISSPTGRFGFRVKKTGSAQQMAVVCAE